MLKQGVISMLAKMQDEYPNALKDEKLFKALSRDVLQNDLQYDAALRYLCIALFEHDALSLLASDIQSGEYFAAINLIRKLTGEGAQNNIAVEVTGYLLLVAGQERMTVEDFVNHKRHVDAPATAPLTSVIFSEHEWLVLEEKGRYSLILSTKVLEKRTYNDSDTEVTWETCSLRDYLNTEFFNSLTAEEKSRIMPCEIANEDNPWFDAKGGNYTTDKIFLLSLDEVVKYFGDSGLLRDNPPAMKMWLNDPGYNKMRKAYDANNIAVVWWLRSPGNTNRSAAAVMGNGFISPAGFCVSNDEGGVRPALWLKQY